MTPQIKTALATAVALISTGLLPYEGDPASDLVDYQRRCSLAQAFHTLHLPTASKGRMHITDGEAHRPTFVAVHYAKQGIGIKNSLHTLRLAQDKMLWIDGKLATQVSDYQLAGEIWEAIGPAFGVDAVWGGRFGDGVHFSCAWKGAK